MISTVKIIYMEENKPDNKDFRIAELHVEGLSNPQIADALGINRSTVYRRLQTPQCKAVVNEIRNIYHNSLIARLHNLAAKVITAYEKKVLDGDVTAGELNGFLRVLSNLFIKDPTLYEFENPKIVSYVQFQRDLDVTPVERFKNGQKGHI
jgi:DNA-binding CsgD family transcriptional regulator